MIRHSAGPLGKSKKSTQETFESLFLSGSLFLFIYLFLFQNACVTTLTGLIFNNRKSRKITFTQHTQKLKSRQLGDIISANHSSQLVFLKLQSAIHGFIFYLQSRSCFYLVFDIYIIYISSHIADRYFQNALQYQQDFFLCSDFTVSLYRTNYSHLVSKYQSQLLAVRFLYLNYRVTMTSLAAYMLY